MKVEYLIKVQKHTVFAK